MVGRKGKAPWAFLLNSNWSALGQRCRTLWQFYGVVARRKVGQSLPVPLACFYRYCDSRDIRSTFSFLFTRNKHISFRYRLLLVMKFYLTSFAVESPHAQYEIISFVNAVLGLSPELEGCIVEAGCFKGGSTAKFSLVAEKLGRPLIVFDSFQGLPEHSENMKPKVIETPIANSELL